MALSKIGNIKDMSGEGNVASMVLIDTPPLENA